jgi:hypothetical protein
MEAGCQRMGSGSTDSSCRCGRREVGGRVFRPSAARGLTTKRQARDRHKRIFITASYQALARPGFGVQKPDAVHPGLRGYAPLMGLKRDSSAGAHRQYTPPVSTNADVR